MKTLLCILLWLLLAVLDLCAQGLRPALVGASRRVVAAGAAPAFVREDTRVSNTSSDATTVIDIQQDITTGQRAIVVATCGALGLSGITDSDGNTWSRETNCAFNSASEIIDIWSATTAATLSAADTITCTWDTPGYNARTVALFVLSGVTSRDYANTNVSGFGSSPSVAASSSAATVGVGVIGCSVDRTYGSSAWTVSGTNHDGQRRNYYVYTNSVGAGTQNPLGTLSSADSWGAVIVGFK